VGWNCVVDNGSVEDARIGAPSASVERFQPVPVPRGDGRHDIGDDVRAAIVERLTSEWSRDPDLTPEKARQLAMWAAASVRALLHELGTLRDMGKSEGNSAKSEGNSSRPQWALDNIYTIGRRELRRLERAGASEIESVSGDRWGHVVRLCEQAGCQGRGVLRDNGGSVLDGPASGAPDAVDVRSTESTPSESTGDSPPWREGPAACTNCGESAKPHPAYADFVGPFCEGCWDRLREHFTSGATNGR
jgi:hypothetical protein